MKRFVDVLSPELEVQKPDAYIHIQSEETLLFPFN